MPIFKCTNTFVTIIIIEIGFDFTQKFEEMFETGFFAAMV